ncbi:hypothetical protein I551_3908 [Mycobacterium ulcerans str. Harvey]|uniref:Uncharacterized protein n=1 Tax=Mycobacterium ulcerans str. Harvey TaxID=1299332 RepID=A0ABP3AE31_MYCUL|nr:hypothetical protein I551_3908 [Mycobacterium ulcerans str. Harvey]
MQQRQQRGALVGIAADDLLGFDLQPCQRIRRVGLRAPSTVNWLGSSGGGPSRTNTG